MDDTKTFAEMFEESYATPKRYSVEKVEATIVKISPGGFSLIWEQKARLYR